MSLDCTIHYRQYCDQGSIMHKILIVEDEVHSRTALTLFFKARGFEVRSAANGAEAITIAQSFHPSILISDWRLGNSADGVSIAKALYQANTSLAIIFLSGHSLQQLKEQCQDIPVKSFLGKPFSLFSLSSIVEQIATPTQEQPLFNGINKPH